MRRPFVAAVVLSAIGSSACDEEFAPETLIEDIRVLGVRAEPADLHPGETARLSALVVGAVDGRPRTLLWLACDPDPFNLGRSACSDTSVLNNLDELAPSAGALPEGMHIIGLGDLAAYRAPPGLFEALPADDARRRSGTLAQALLFAVDESVSPSASPEELSALLGKVQRREVPSVLALFRIKVSEDAHVNENPDLSGLSAGGILLPEGSTVAVLPGSSTELLLEASGASFEEYEQLTPDGVEPRTEQLIAAWYSTTGRFSPERLVLGSTTAESFKAPGSPKHLVPENRRGRLYGVVRDTRGGVAWLSRPLYVCDESLPAPTIDALTPSEGPSGGLVRLSGANLDSVLEVWLGGALLADGALRDGAYEGLVPELSPGSYSVVVRGKGCTHEETSRVYRIQ